MEWRVILAKLIELRVQGLRFPKLLILLQLYEEHDFNIILLINSLIEAQFFFWLISYFPCLLTMAELLPIYFSIIAFFCALGAMALAIFHIYRHLLNYTEPTYQRYIVRIIFMVPVYALMSFLSLIFPESSIYFNSIREVYEAWVIYNFLSLCLAWVGGPGAVVLSLSGRAMKPSWCLMTCCFPPIPLDGRFIRRCKQGCLQFVILKPFLVAVTLILYAKGKYKDGNFSPKQSYLYLTIIYTISYTMALYALALFYVACKDLLQPFNPVPKFIIIKSVVFLTYWQVKLYPQFVLIMKLYRLIVALVEVFVISLKSREST
ncbi:hypothetical protein OIU74_021229 [Salix koriyanagi]|uniref:Uncharacterized protein n=1 Tax=Salix koriyanagi TaxID=2511006 RepID=A0A9Q0SN43_9ROSI|nr:hypothetical protein OIU74_021229 [Salix koriyanagi]